MKPGRNLYMALRAASYEYVHRFATTISTKYKTCLELPEYGTLLDQLDFDLGKIRERILRFRKANQNEEDETQEEGSEGENNIDQSVKSVKQQPKSGRYGYSSQEMKQGFGYRTRIDHGNDQAGADLSSPPPASADLLPPSAQSCHLQRTPVTFAEALPSPPTSRRLC
ncbi:hypothetical protein BDZ91DRAFT_847138 [Kalaharituber pfeilii]|nr:hypothetical protein BDZ91DRAFT_847138 [Kalaharituber pfeilii]